jgi:hypothetical protein
MSSIRADIQLNAAPFLAGIARVQSSMRNLQAATAGLMGAFFAMRSTIASFQAVFDGMKNALDLGGKFADLSASTGASVSELVMLSQAFQNAGMGAEAVGPMIARFQKALAGVNEEGQSTASALQKLGLNALALNRMSVAAQFQELGRAISSIEDPAERTRRAMELFGRSGAQMLALFRDPEAFTRAAAEIGTMGDVLEANAGKFDSMSDALTTVGGKMDQFFVGLMSGAGGADALERAATIDFTPMGQAVGGVGSSLKGWLPSLKTIETWAGSVFPLFAQINGSIKGLIIPKMADSVAGSLDKRTQEATQTFDAKIRSVGSEDERGKIMEQLSAAIENASEKLTNLDAMMADIPQSERSKIADALQREVAAYEQQRSVLSAITPEVMAANAAEADRAAILAKSAAEAAKLAAQLEKALEARDASAEQRVLDGLSPQDAQDRVLSQIGTEGMEGVLSEMGSLRAMGNDATDAQKARLMQLIEAEKTLLEIKGRQTAEDEKRAEHAQKLSELMGDLSLDADKALAMATGDKDAVQEIESQKAANELQKRLELEGMDSAAAAELAQKQAKLQGLASELQNSPATGLTLADAQRSIGLGGNAFSDQRRPQEEMVRKQQDANRLLADIKGLLSKQGPRVVLAEAFD